MQYISSLHNTSILKRKTFRILDNKQPQNWKGTKSKNKESIFAWGIFHKGTEKAFTKLRSQSPKIKSKYHLLFIKWPRCEMILITFLKIMPYLTFFFLFFSNLFQTKLFCHLSLMSFPLLIKENVIQHSINTGLLKKRKKSILSMA